METAGKGAPPAGPDDGRPAAHEVFISYSHRDAATANAVCAALEGAGIRCWIAPRDAPVGRPWKASIVEAIRSARAVVLVFSDASNGSTQVTREVDIAFEARPQIPIFPFRIEDVTMSDELAYCIGNKHWLDALTAPLDAHVGRLIVALREAGCTSSTDRGLSVGESPSPPMPSAGADDAWPELPPVAVAAPVPDAAAAPHRPRAGGPFALAAFALLVAAIAAAALLTSGNRVPDASARGRAARTDTAPRLAPADVPAAPGGAGRGGAPGSSGLDSSRPGGEMRAPPVPDTARAPERLPPRPGRQAAGDGARGPLRLPDSLAVACARLLERVSLGEVLSSQDATRLRRDCQGASR